MNSRGPFSARGDLPMRLGAPEGRVSRPLPAPVVAICGLSGGAGASTLAYLTARMAVDNGERPVLLCDAGAATGGLAVYARAESPRSLSSLANSIAAAEPLGEGLFCDGGNGLRVVASPPQLNPHADGGGLIRLIRDAREAHVLIVVDCGTLASEASLQLFNAATHIVWILAASVSGIRRGSRVLELFELEAARRELVVARHDPTRRPAPIEKLTTLAAGRNARLVLMPQIPDLAERPAEDALEAAGLALDAIRMAIRT